MVEAFRRSACLIEKIGLSLLPMEDHSHSSITITVILFAVLFLLAPDRVSARLGAPSLLQPLEKAALVALGEVVWEEKRAGLQLAGFRILITIAGPGKQEEITIVSQLGSSGLPITTQRYFHIGDRVIILLEPYKTGNARDKPTPNDWYRCVEGYLNCSIVIDDNIVEEQAAISLLKGYAEKRRDKNALKAFLKEQLAIKNSYLKLGIFFDLINLLDATDIDFLLALAVDKDQSLNIRTPAIASIGLVSPKHIPDSLESLLTDYGSEPEVRKAIIKLYGASADADDCKLRILRLALSDPEPKVREAAVRAYAEPAAVPIFRRHYFRESNAGVRSSIRFILEIIATPESRALLKDIEGTERRQR